MIAFGGILDYSENHNVCRQRVEMGAFDLVRWAIGAVAAAAAGVAVAGSLSVGFPPLNGAVVLGSYPQQPVTVATQTFTIPPGEHVVAATISGYWGTAEYPNSTAPVDVYLDGILVAQCVLGQTCSADSSGLTPWSRNMTAAELLHFDDGSATLTVVQTDNTRVRLGASTLTIQTGPIVVPGVPALSPSALLAVLAAVAAAGGLALRRVPRA